MGDVVVKAVKGTARKGGKKNRKHGRNGRTVLHKMNGFCNLSGCRRLGDSRVFNRTLGVYVARVPVAAVSLARAAEKVR